MKRFDMKTICILGPTDNENFNMKNYLFMNFTSYDDGVTKYMYR